MLIDVRGLSCPIPVVRTKGAVDQGETSLTITGDSGVARENVTRYLRSAGFTVVEEAAETGTWRIRADKQPTEPGTVLSTGSSEKSRRNPGR